MQRADKPTVILAALVAALVSRAAFAVPAIDGSWSVAGSLTSASQAIAITTPSTNDVVILEIVTNLSTGAATVSSITGGLSWTKRFGVSHTFTNCGSLQNQTCTQRYERWWAPSTGTLSSVTFTINLSAAADNVTVVGGGVSGSPNINSPWDTNGALPAFNVSGPPAAASVVVSTTQTNDLILFGGGTSFWGTGFNMGPSDVGTLKVASTQAISGLNNSGQVWVGEVTSPQPPLSGHTFNIGTNGGQTPWTWTVSGDAIAGSLPVGGSSVLQFQTPW